LNPGRSKKRPDQLRGPPSLLHQWEPRTLPVLKQPGHATDHSPHLVSRIIIVALYANSVCMLSWCVQGHLYLNSYLTVFRTSVIVIIFLHGLGRLTCSSIDVLPSFPGASTISSSSGFVVEGVFRQSVVIHSLKVVDPILFVFGSYSLCSRDL